ncbi:hypothetical protein [Afifella marina]|uniref:Uncharacterized protein n=1 Tax=Afifella marina DSM 2698 TaxID=1120955 RepID=A0A1G5MP21_AFIMA|nr:hypothetical protein [Afifella marina]MBK1623963.1 hypothetical protein [Afifella marina DSM 2698]MBK1627121.1 hypothetical protein [Afifella marina]MBK5918850.1 hypothetical protein [Afifella marina]RAI22546.1 hypothetical protein CH311_02430 [Afifella marina DSM 2698]SCZ26348.1 hypothetical protein SAMN03080610_00935 [Afifella marina DSM 2698]
MALRPGPLFSVPRWPGGALLASSPFLFGFASEVWVPLIAVGLFEIVAALVTKTTPSKSAQKWN